MDAVAVAAGAATGALLRHYIGESVGARWSASAKPWATCCINVTGSLVLCGLVGFASGGSGPERALGTSVTAAPTTSAGAAAVAPAVSRRTFLLLGTGLCGGFTTYSTFAVDVALAGTAARGLALAAVTNGGSVGAAMLGLQLARRVALR